MSKIEKLLVVGAGQMGAGIAQVAAVAGLQVFLRDISMERANAGKKTIATSLDRFVKKEKLSAAERDAALARITPTDQIDAARDAQFAIEAATENVTLKQKIFAELDEKLPPSVVLATNTSSISVTLLAASTKRPDKIIGMHFFNPVPMMSLVEVIRGLATSEATYTQTRELAAALSKEAVTSKDAPGFIVNRILVPMLNEAFYSLQEGIATAEDIDKAVKLGTNLPMGPLLLADFIGLDVCLAVLEVLHKEIGDPKFRACPLLRKYVEAGWLGKKTGRGIYVYDEAKK